MICKSSIYLQVLSQMQLEEYLIKTISNLKERRRWTKYSNWLALQITPFRIILKLIIEGSSIIEKELFLS